MNYQQFLRECMNDTTKGTFYCASLSNIKEKTWLILDYEKFFASKKLDDKNVDVTKYVVDVIRKNNELIGVCIDSDTIPKTSLTPIPRKIDAIAYCLNKEQTGVVFNQGDSKVAVLQTIAEILFSLYDSCMYTVYFSSNALPNDQRKKISALIKNMPFTKFLIIPYTDTTEEREKLCLEFTLKNI